MTALSTLTVRNPYSGDVVGETPLASPAEIATALDAAAAYRNTLSRHQRAEILNGVAALMREQRDELATLSSSESGLSLKDTRHEVNRSVDVFRFAAIEALRDDGEVFSGDTTELGRDRRAYTLRSPVGLVGAITPFNHPFNQVSHKVAPAIAAGAPIVCKPSEKTPFCGLKLGELIAEAGMPEGAVRILAADPATYLEALLTHPAVEVVSFTGGVAVGKLIAGRLGYRRAVLELGGNDPMLVLGDADLEEAARLAVQGAFANSGQRCTAVKRIIAVDTVADELAERITAGARSIVCGDPLDPATDTGTVIDARAAETIERRINEAVAAGATLLAGGERDGALIAPAVLDHVTPDMELVAQETFGPVAPIIRVRDLDDAIATANGAAYALSSSVISNDWRAIQRCIRELRAGTVNVREVPGWRTELTPFGGIGDSGLGVKEGVREAIKACTHVKLYTLPWS